MATSISTAVCDSIGIKPPNYRLPDSAHIGIVTLAVSSLANSISFYHEIIGLAVLKQEEDSADLGAGETVLLKLAQLPGVQPIGPRTRLGLYHTAFLLPDRPALGSFIQHLHLRGKRYGVGDHIYSEAVYLVDPDGLSVEVYADRSREEWKTRGRELLSATGSLDISALAATSKGEWMRIPAGTTVGHVHLYIGNLEEASRFYHDALGFAVMTWSYPGALFVSAGGYHHHVGLNVWAAGSPSASQTDARLLSWELVVPHLAEIDGIRKSLSRLGWNTRQESDGALTITDPWEIAVRVLVR